MLCCGDLVGDPLLDVYAALDKALASIMKALTPSDTVVLLASHGMGAHYSGVEALPTLTSMVDGGLAGNTGIPNVVIPHLLSMYAAPFREQLRIFPVPNNGAYAAFRLNLKGREPKGKVEPHAADDVIGAFADALLSLREATSRTPIFRSAVRTRDAFYGPLKAQLPDLLMEWNRDHPIRRIVTPWGELENVNRGNPRTGDHTPDGMMWVLGRGTRHPVQSFMELSDLKDYILELLEFHARAQTATDDLPGMMGS